MADFIQNGIPFSNLPELHDKIGNNRTKEG